MSYDEADVQWNRVWVAAFVAVAVVLLGLIPTLPAKVWLAVAAVSFGTFEAVGLRRHRDRLPPLTYIARRYLPRWATITAVGVFTGLAGGYWFGFAHPWSLAALLGLYTWGTSHFDVTYEESHDGAPRG